MAITRQQAVTGWNEEALTTTAHAYPTNPSTGSLCVIAVDKYDPTYSFVLADLILGGTATRGTATMDRVQSNGSLRCAIYSVPITAGGTVTVQFTRSQAGSGVVSFNVGMIEYAGADTSGTRLEDSDVSSGTTDNPTVTSMTSAAGAVFVGTVTIDTGTNYTGGIAPASSFVTVYEVENGSTNLVSSAADRIVTTGTSVSPAWTINLAGEPWISCGAVYKEAGGGAPSMVADPGAQTITGVAATTTVGRALSAVAGSLTLSGQAATTSVGRAVSADAGSHAVSGQAATTLVDRLLSANSGAYTNSGIDASLAVGLEINAAAGTLAVTGQDITPSITRTLSATAGSYASGGVDATLQEAAAFALEGFGADAVGGEGQTTVHVTTLADNAASPPAGSLREALAGSNRIIVFDVGGTITLDDPIWITGRSYITIDGTEAPSPGITLYGYVLGFLGASHHIIVRNIRHRGGQGDSGGDSDDFSVQDGSHDICFDRCSASMPPAVNGDGCFDCNGGTGAVYNITWQWGLIHRRNSFGDGGASLIAYSARNVTIHHSIIDAQERTSLFKWAEDQTPADVSPYTTGDFINNIVWNWGWLASETFNWDNNAHGGQATCSDGGAKVNVHYCFYQTNNPIAGVDDEGVQLDPNFPNSRLYTGNNYSGNGSTVINNNGVRNETTPFAAPAVTTHTSMTALVTSLLANCGARGTNFGLDSIDQAVIDDITDNADLPAETNPSILAGTGSLAVTGVAATLAASHGLAGGAGTGAFTETGVAATVVVGRALAGGAVTGSLVATGVAATLVADRVALATEGAFILSGIDATLSVDAIAVSIDAATGVFTESGVAATLVTGRVLSAVAGSCALTGVDATLVVTPAGALSIDAGVGSFALTGVSAALLTSGGGTPSQCVVVS